ncbi:MAG: OB-fold domain-containing protein [Pseudomonadota bacterium]
MAETTPRGVGAGSVILPDRGGPVAQFWQGVQEGKLLLQHCHNCGHCWHPMADVCAKCQSFDIEWRPSVGGGTLFSYTVVHHATHPVVKAWLPYTLCLVQLDEGPRILATLDPDRGEDLDIGRRVRLGFRKAKGGFQLPVFSFMNDDEGGDR